MRRLGLCALGCLFGLACTGSAASGPGGGGSGGRSGSGGAPAAGSGGAPATGGSGGQAGAQAPRDADADTTTTGSGGAPSTDGPAPVDGGGDGPPAAACGAGALFCDDFEKYAAGADLGPAWTTTVMGGTVRVDATRAFTGKQAVHITTAASMTSMLQIVKRGAPLFPLPGNKMYGRMMMWLSQNQPDHFNLIEGTGTLPGMTTNAKYAYGGKFGGLMAAYTVRPREGDPATVDCGDKPTPPGYPEKKWVCVEWSFDGAKDEMHLSLDGSPQPAVDVVKTGGCDQGAAAPADGLWHAPVFDKLALGIYGHPFATPVDVFIDDVVIGSAPVGCPKSP